VSYRQRDFCPCLKRINGAVREFLEAQVDERACIGINLQGADIC
jgi:hypothetical protein